MSNGLSHEVYNLAPLEKRRVLRTPLMRLADVKQTTRKTLQQEMSLETKTNPPLYSDFSFITHNLPSTLILISPPLHHLHYGLEKNNVNRGLLKGLS